MELFSELMDEHQIPLLGGRETPIFYTGVGKIDHGIEMGRRILSRGFFTSLGIYPSVPMNRTGIRVTINKTHTEEEIRLLVKTIAEEMELFLAEKGMSKADLYQFLKLPYPVLS